MFCNKILIAGAELHMSTPTNPFLITISLSLIHISNNLQNSRCISQINSYKWQYTMDCSEKTLSFVKCYLITVSPGGMF